MLHTTFPFQKEVVQHVVIGVVRRVDVVGVIEPGPDFRISRFFWNNRQGLRRRRRWLVLTILKMMKFTILMLTFLKIKFILHIACKTIHNPVLVKYSALNSDELII
jgi:hypothetical protein